MRFVGVDPATNTGMVSVDETGGFVARRSVTCPPKSGMPHRLALTFGAVRQFLLEQEPRVVGVEILRTHLVANATVKTFGIQAQFVGTVMAAIGAHGAPVFEFKPPCVVGWGRNRRVVGLPTKEDARDELRRAWGKLADELTLDECDAGVIAREVWRAIAKAKQETT
jgi:Holliday junction resolvasome RuvABC endonuclease subunit